MLDRFKVPPADQVRVSEAALRRTVTDIFEQMHLTPEDAALGVPFDSAIQYDAFEISTDADELIRRHRVIDARNFLLENRPFVEIGRNVVSGRANELDPSRVRLMVRLRAFEARQD